MSDTTNVIRMMQDALKHENGNHKNVTLWKLSRLAYEDYRTLVSRSYESSSEHRDASGVVYRSPVSLPPVPPPPSVWTEFYGAKIVVSDDAAAPYFAYEVEKMRR